MLAVTVLVVLMVVFALAAVAGLTPDATLAPAATGYLAVVGLSAAFFELVFVTPVFFVVLFSFLMV